ncbi:4-hydroxy-tetrahydrodipicolinate synthase [Bordetella avium]|uniref:4-hydroxy-tetrahydrodipicolinate synthase n=1 Tax=Bordetella avium TaxID=521 RepID=UPI000E0A3D87|nr:4-hydroxy-tetrahydrodipicolinate synthase [Bordetella avium]RIQ14986.1 4-hydroxy-tetrahydrodipicolinate synthase [Bordetella avium]RIQ41449.1 4-hydroxy-tetrahydrodipicolinate synthase [Bordetella avium]RIQ45761.1 4-hydroxy-tetrahydrodipicolinate synthase [Bordetella avium]RIQ46689.1 4-hydroxy-tetrahydrodipicolinate synthase [Bordetella avium]RIQ49786.1 4-hydroxy-tetrahydrodipicolinate synthase [Bordetella avium]
MSSITEVEPLNTASRTASFQGVWVPLVTPFDEEGPDLFSLRRLMRQYRDAGVDGVVVCGSTGEAAAMDEYEQLAVLDTVLDEAGALPVVMGLAGNHQRDVLRRQAVFNTRGLAGLLTPAPYYVRPGQAGLADYFRALADASAVPLILYDIPYRTGEHIDIDTLLVLAEHPNIRAVKDCGGSLDKTQALIAHGGLQVLAGEDMQMLGTLAMGGSGLIAASAHVRADLFVAMYQAMQAQQVALARQIYHALAPVMRLLFAEPNPAPLKGLLARQGVLREHLRAPMAPASLALISQLEAAVAELDRRYPRAL